MSSGWVPLTWKREGEALAAAPLSPLCTMREPRNNRQKCFGSFPWVTRTYNTRTATIIVDNRNAVSTSRKRYPPALEPPHLVVKFLCQQGAGPPLLCRAVVPLPEVDDRLVLSSLVLVPVQDNVRVPGEELAKSGMEEKKRDVFHSMIVT